MSLFGSSPTEDKAPSTPGRNNRASGLFDDDDQPRSHKKTNSSGSGLFADDAGQDETSPWDMPTPRKQQSRAELIRRLLPASDAPESYLDVFESVLREDGHNGRIPAAGIAKLFAMARLDADAQASIMGIVAPGAASDVSLGQNEFNVLLALVGLAQEGDVVSLDGVDERKRSKFFFFVIVQVYRLLFLFSLALNAMRKGLHRMPLHQKMIPIYTPVTSSHCTVGNPLQLIHFFSRPSSTQARRFHDPGDSPSCC